MDTTEKKTEKRQSTNDRCRHQDDGHVTITGQRF